MPTLNFCDLKRLMKAAASDLGINLTTRRAEKLTRYYLTWNNGDEGKYIAYTDPTGEQAVRHAMRAWLNSEEVTA